MHRLMLCGIRELYIVVCVIHVHVHVYTLYMSLMVYMQQSSRPVSPTGTGVMFQGVLDQEKRVLVEKICSLKREMARSEEKMEFFESHSHQLTEDIQKKSK